jgi:uncharacterized membrane protein YoaK (UPF0700 family)
MHRVKLRYLLAGGSCLAALAGALNAAFLLLLGTSVSHLSGDVARFAIDLGAQDGLGGPAFLLLAALLGFVFGALVSGFLIHHPTLELSRPYGRSVTAIGVTLIGSWACFGRYNFAAVALAGMACGFQNALATHYRGLVLRTTHVTGLLTDLGVALGMRLRGYEVQGWKMLVPLVLVLSFCAGAGAGGFATAQIGRRAVLGTGILYVACGLLWTLLKRSVFHIEAPATSEPAGAAPR